MSQVVEAPANTVVDEAPAEEDRGSGIIGGGERELERLDSSEGEGDIEVEQVSVEDHTVAHTIEHSDQHIQGLSEIEHDGSNHHQEGVGVAPFESPSVHRRTLIALWQRSILEKYFQEGMTSASQLQAHLHKAATDQTGLDINVVKNWIRNRKRPAAVKAAEKLNKVLESSFPTLTQAPPLLSMPTVTLMNTTISHHTPSAATATGRSEQHNLITPSSLSPLAKRSCLEQSPISLPSSYQSPQTINLHNPISSSSSSPSVSGPMLVKVRVADSGENDFIEVDLPALSYSALLNACCEEMEIQPSEIAKIRKLPNVWVRKDKDVQRMKEGQELEVILNPSASTMNALLSVNPFNSTSSVPMFSTQRNEHDQTLLAPLSTELHPPMNPEIPTTTQLNGPH